MLEDCLVLGRFKEEPVGAPEVSLAGVVVHDRAFLKGSVDPELCVRQPKFPGRGNVREHLGCDDLIVPPRLFLQVPLEERRGALPNVRQHKQDFKKEQELAKTVDEVKERLKNLDGQGIGKKE